MKKIIKYTLGIIVTAIIAAVIWMVGPTFFAPKPINAGIEIGAQAPTDMALAGSTGSATMLGDEMGENGMVLFLVRSADWCPYCKAQMKRTKDIQKPLKDKGFSLAVLSYDDPEILALFAGDNEITYTLLSDKDRTMIEALGLRDHQYGKDHFAFGVPLASILFLAPDGTVLHKYIAADYRSRPSNEDVLAMLETIPAE